MNPSLEENLWSTRNLETMVHERPELEESSSLGLPLPWEPLDAKQGNRYEPRWGNAANSWRSLVIMGVPGQPTGIKQEVYLPVQRTLSYKGSFFRTAPQWPFQTHRFAPRAEQQRVACFRNARCCC